MINKAQKQRVRKLVEAILAQIDWPPERLCELAVRTALAVSKSPEGAEFREWGNHLITYRQDMGYNDVLKSTYREFNKYNTVQECMNETVSMELYSAINALDSFKRLIEEALVGVMFKSSIKISLVNAKLAAIARGEKLEIPRIIEEMKNENYKL